MRDELCRKAGQSHIINDMKCVDVKMVKFCSTRRPPKAIVVFCCFIMNYNQITLNQLITKSCSEQGQFKSMMKILKISFHAIYPAIYRNPQSNLNRTQHTRNDLAYAHVPAKTAGAIYILFI